MQLNDNWKPQRHKACSWTSLDGETVVVHADKGTVSVLNNLAGQVWQLCDGEQSLAGVLGCLTEDYDAETAVIRSETQTFLQDMIAKGLMYPPEA